MKTLNFDKFIAEKDKEKILVTILGKEYEIKHEIPAIVPIMMARAEGMKEEERNTLYTRMIMKSADAMLGESVIDELCSRGLTQSDLVDLVGKLFSIIRGLDAEEDSTEELSDDAAFVSKEDTEKKSL